MLKTYRQLSSLLETRERRLFLALIGLMILTAFAELLSLSVFIALLVVLAQPDIIQTKPILADLYTTFGFESSLSFQVALSLAVAALILLGVCIKAGAAFAISRFSTMCAYKISCRLFAAYLRQPYNWSLDRNSAQLSKHVLAEAEQISHRVATPSARILSNFILALTIIGFLFYTDTVIAATALGVVGGGYGLIYLLVNKRLSTIGQSIVDSNSQRFQLAHEALNGFKEMKLGGLGSSYIARFDDPSRRRARGIANTQLMTELPRFFLEGLTFILLLTLVLGLLIRNSGDIAAAVPTLGIFVFAIMRLLPTLQQVYYGFAMLRTGQAVLRMICKDYNTVIKTMEDVTEVDRNEQMSLQDALEFRDVSFQYPSASKTALNKLSLRLKANTTIGIVGGTGAGKTTFVDLLLGLLHPDSGEISVDGTVLTNENRRRWQNTLGYVPQQIYLTDDTIAANIAYGLSASEIDYDQVVHVAKIAALHEFIEAELPSGYETVVGERGVRLSGGQRQRIGIARALYHDPSVLVMDEATSALDTITEGVVMEAMQSLQYEKTIVLIAHRLSTVRNCDVILLMEHGKILASGTYDELNAQNATFQKMVQAGREPDLTAASE